MLNHRIAIRVLSIFAMTLSLTGCPPDSPPLVAVQPTALDNAATPVSALSSVNDAVVMVKSEYSDLLRSFAKDPGNYYVQLRVRGAAVPIDPKQCLDPSLLKIVRKVFFTTGASGMIYFSYTLSDPVIPIQPHQAPIVAISENDSPPAGTDPCYTNAFNGPITPLVRVNGGQPFSVTVTRKYSTTADVKLVSDVFTAAKTASTAFGGAGFALGTLNATTLQGAASNIDSAISSAISGAASDVRTVPLPSTDGKDAMLIRLLNIQQDDLTGVHLSALNGGLAVLDVYPVKSVFATRPMDSDTSDTYKPSYTTNSFQIVQLEVTPGGKSIMDIVNSAAGINFLTVYNSIKVTDANASNSMGTLCNQLQLLLSGDTFRLSTDDERIARWAVLKTLTTYDATAVIRSKRCWNTDDDSAAKKLNAIYTLNIPTDQPAQPVDATGNLNALNITFLNALLPVGGGSHDALNNLVDLQNFQIQTWGVTLAGLPPGKQWSDLKGSAALDAFSNIGAVGTYGAGCWQGPASSAGVTKSGIMITVGGKRIPAAIVRDDNQKIQRLIFGAGGDIASFVGTPSTWPGSC